MTVIGERQFWKLAEPACSRPNQEEGLLRHAQPADPESVRPNAVTSVTAGSARSSSWETPGDNQTDARTDHRRRRLRRKSISRMLACCAATRCTSSTTCRPAASTTSSTSKRHPYFHYTIDRVQNERVTAELVDRVDMVYHLAAEVGVRRVIDSPISTIENNVQATEVVFVGRREEGEAGALHLDLRGLRPEHRPPLP